MRGEFNAVGILWAALLSIVALVIGLLLIGSGGVIGEIQRTGQEEKNVLLCDDAVQTVVNNPGKVGEGSCLQKYCTPTYDDIECGGVAGIAKCTKKNWEVNGCEYTGPDEGCECTLIDTGLRVEKKPCRRCWSHTQEKKICMTTSGYNTPGLKNKVDIYKVCGYDMTGSDKSPGGALEDERSELWFRIGRLMHLACEHGRDLNEVDDFPVFVEACKFRIEILDYEVTNDKCELVGGGEDSNKYKSLVDKRSFSVACLDVTSEMKDKVRDCKDYINPGNAGSLYKYYLCISGNGNPEKPPCVVEDYTNKDNDEYQEEYKIVYLHKNNPVVAINYASQYIDEDREGMFCG